MAVSISPVSSIRARISHANSHAPSAHRQGRFTQNERLRRAIGLLVANPSLTIKQISGMSGFDDPNYFAKVFRKQYAMSPPEFRGRGMIA